MPVISVQNVLSALSGLIPAKAEDILIEDSRVTLALHVGQNQGKEAKLSEFNPKDLFSQEYGGIKKCLEAL